MFPLLELAKADEFTWLDIHQKCWSELKFILKFALKLSFVSSNDRIIIFTDSSALSAGYVLVKVDPETLDFFPVLAESKLFKDSEKNQSIIFKEALSLFLSLKQREKYIKSSQHDV